MYIATSAFFSAYTQADLFGKFIFFSLFILSVISWIILLQKVYYTKKIKRLSSKFDKFYSEKKENLLNASINHNSFHPFLEVFGALKLKTLEILKKNKFFLQNEKKSVYLSQSDIDLLESHIHVTSINLSKDLEKNLFVLSTIVTLAPFLGLLGTVWGILITFSELQVNSLTSGNSAILSGLSMALATTVVGLVVAIPALIAYNYLKNSIKEFNKDLDLFSHKLLTTIEIQYKKVDFK
jgi:biopolymer transport protein TolQ